MKPIVAASPASVKTIELNLLCINSIPHHNVVSSSETEKRCGGRWSPTTVLFESQWTTAFPGRARGDRVTRGPSAEAVGHRVVPDPHPRPYAFRAHRR